MLLQFLHYILEIRLHKQERKAFLNDIHIIPHLLILCYLCYIRNQLIIFYAWIHLERNNAWKIWSLLLIEYEYSVIIFSLNDIEELRRLHLIFLWSAFHLLKISVNTSMRTFWWNFFFSCVYLWGPGILLIKINIEESSNRHGIASHMRLMRTVQI